MHGFSVSSWISAISAESSWKSANSSWKSANRSLCYLIIVSPQCCIHSSKILHVLWANSSWNFANSSWKSANSSWAQKPENRKAQIKRPTPIVKYFPLLTTIRQYYEPLFTTVISFLVFALLWKVLPFAWFPHSTFTIPGFQSRGEVTMPVPWWHLFNWLVVDSIDWFKGKNTGTSHFSRENLWCPVQ